MNHQSPAVTLWLVAVLAMVPWLVAVEHLVTLPSEAARQDLADGPWPGLLTAQIVGGLALALAMAAAWVLARRRPHFVVGVLLTLALVMGWLVRPLAWKNAPPDVFLIERGKLWVFWLVLSLLGMVLVAAAAFIIPFPRVPSDRALP